MSSPGPSSATVTESLLELRGTLKQKEKEECIYVGEIQEEVSQKQWSGVCECFLKESKFFLLVIVLLQCCPVLSVVQCCMSNKLFLCLTNILHIFLILAGTS